MIIEQSTPAPSSKIFDFACQTRVNHEAVLEILYLHFSEQPDYCEQKILHTKRMSIFQVKDRKTQMQVDLSVNNLLAVQNSQLIKMYAMCDVRFCKLIFWLKSWNKQNFPEERKRLSSYAWALILITFL